MTPAVVDRPAPPSVPPEIGRDVLARCKARDPMAFRAFVVRYERPVFALLSRILGHGPHVDDLAQEAFLRAFRAFPGFDIDLAAKPSTWILTIATRLALDHKKRAVIPTVPIEAAANAGTHATPETEAHRREIAASIARAAAALPDDQRVAFVLSEFHGLSITEIADIVEVPEATVRTRLFRARAKLKDSLGALAEES
jgi:RNA polymerase sigma-70 factor (ECF subfamily)